MTKHNRKTTNLCIILIISILTINITTATIQSTPTTTQYDYDIDIDYVYNLTTVLSNIIYTEYNTTQGEIPKSRAFGTPGEHKAADILHHEMTKLGLYVTKEKIQNTPEQTTLTEKIEIIDYHLKIQQTPQDPKTPIDCYISPAHKGPRNNPTQLTQNITFENLILIEKPQVGHPLQYLRNIGKYKQDFVFITQDDSYNPAIQIPPIKKILGTIFSPYSDPVLFWTWFRYQLELSIWYTFFPHCQGLIRYDFHNDTYNMDYTTNWPLPVLFINGTHGNDLLNNITTAKIDYHLQQHLNTSVTSYNVIGQLNGTDPNKIIILDSLYDSVWTQGTADSAIGMSIVLGVAKYFTEYNITPKYTIQFIGFGGEEYGFRGALYHETTHKDDYIQYLIDLNQLGFTQTEPKLYLELLSNNRDLLNNAYTIATNLEYTNSTSAAGVRKHLMPLGAPSNDQPFARNRLNCHTISLLKGLNWVYHHRTGQNHTEGDSLKYFNHTDVQITSQIILELLIKIAI